MFAPRLSIFRFGEAKILAGPSVALFAPTMVLSFRYGLFPFWYDGLSPGAYWGMSAATTLGIFISLFLHDLSHLFLEKRLGGKPKSVDFYPFGDVPVGDEPSVRKAEGKVAFVGPLFSLVLGLGLFGICVLGDKNGLAVPWVGVLFHLAAANLTLALFNFLPFFPLDGGRALRARHWRRGKNFLRANTLATRGGLVLSLILIFGGTVLVFDGKFLTGGWVLAFGITLGYAARTIRESAFLWALLKDRKVREVMNASPVMVSPLLTLERLASDYFDRYRFKVFPAVRGNELVGFVREKDLGIIPLNLWKECKVSEVVTSSSSKNTVSPGETALKALDLMNEHGLKMVLVGEKGKLAGIITRQDLWAFGAAHSPRERRRGAASSDFSGRSRGLPDEPQSGKLIRS